MSFTPGGGGGGSLASNTDVALSNPINAQVLQYHAATQKWKNAAQASANDGTSVVAFGADPTGVADSTSAFQTAINAGDITIPAGTYRVGKIDYTGTSRSIWATGPATIIQTVPLGVFYLTGTWTALGDVSSYATVRTNLVTPGEAAPTTSDTNVTVLTLDAAANVTLGDVVKVVSDDISPLSRNLTDAQNSRQGEFSMVGITSTGTSVTLGNILYEPHVTNVRLARLNDTSFRIGGPLTFDTDPAIRNTAVFGAVIKLRAAKFCDVTGITIMNTLGRAIGNYTYAANFENIKFVNLSNRPSKSHYGYGVQDSGWLTRVSNCHGQNLRHLYSEGGGGCVTNSPDYEYYGGGSFSQVSDCTAMNCQSQAFDTHGSAYAVSFANCVVYGTFTGADSAGSGYTARGRNIRFDNCLVDGAWAGFGIVAAGTVLRNCVARRIEYMPLTIGGDSSDAKRVLNVTGIQVLDSEFETSDGNTAALLGNTGYTSEARIARCTFRHLAPKSGGRAIEFTTGFTADISDITLDISQAPNAVAMSGLQITDDSVAITGRGVTILGGSGAYIGLNLFGYGASGTQANIQLADIAYQHASVTPVVPSQFINLTLSYIFDVGSTNTRSSALSQAVSSGTVLPTANKLDERLYVRLTGSAGNVTLGSLSAGVNGQSLSLINATNGDVTIPSLSIIPAGGAGSYVYLSNAWRLYA